MLSNNFFDKENKQALIIWKLFVKFLKKNSLMTLLYCGQDKSYYKRASNAILYNQEDLFIKLISSDRRYKIKWLQYSQLWRFYLLDNINEIKTQDNFFVQRLISTIKNNGLRESKEVKQYFDKYKIKTKYEKH